MNFVNSEMFKTLVAALEADLRPDGDWQFVKSRRSFENKTSIGKNIVMIEHHNFARTHSFTFTLCVRVDCVEDILNSKTRSLSKIDERATTTIATHCGYLSGKKWRSWYVLDNIDAVICANEFFNILRIDGFSYFSKYSSIEKIYADIHPNDDRTSRISSSPAYAAIKALALAECIGKNLRNEIRYQRKVLASVSDGLARFERELFKYNGGGLVK